MTETTLFKIETPYRRDVDVKGFFFGEKDKKTVCFCGALRGNEIQQTFIASSLVRRMKELETAGCLAPGVGILIIPCINPFSMNIGRRFWPMDNTDINRMFPGYDKGETTQRIADAVFEKIKGYEYGVQFASFYLAGDFIPHVRLMETEFQDESMLPDFALPYGLLRRPLPIDTTTLNYNWQVFETKAFSLYTRETDRIDDDSAKTALDAALRFLVARGFAKCRTFNAYRTRIIREDSLVAVTSPCGGFIRRRAFAGEEVTPGQTLAEILDPLHGDVKAYVTSPVEGQIFFAHKAPIVTEHQSIFFIVE